MKRWLMILGGGLLLIGANAGLTVFLAQGLVRSEVGALRATLGIEEAPPEAPEADAAASDEPALYVPLEPKFVVNFGNPAEGRFLQIGIELMTREKEIVERVNKAMPALRNNIVLLLSSKQVADLESRAGKEQLQQEILADIATLIGDPQPGVEAVYFTSFVMQ